MFDYSLLFICQFVKVIIKTAADNFEVLTTK